MKTEVLSTVVLSGERPEAQTDLSDVAGYRLEQRIGVGGFGEVWRAVGPGGFVKAVKILFGNLSGLQAETELKALNRIRDVRHPFLLSIERIEVVRGQVIVVTELADGSLDQRYRDYVASGRRGIPRDELIGYLRDAADALDFMYEQHGLQHLDIKPENIMLQGNHAKVGDFGLTKSITAEGHSLVNGFTPLYAPPELFEGRPSRGSDQYSLAIVYQMMLTGTPPFNGRTAAQLTAQHLRSAPDLSVLHPSDRPAVARALSKNPQTRYPSCRQFVDELARRRHSGVAAGKSAPASDVAGISRTTALKASDLKTAASPETMPASEPLTPVSSRDVNWALRPTVFIGIGGLGCQTLLALQEKIQAAAGGQPVPCMQYLLVDSNDDVLKEVTRKGGDSQGGIRSITLPLRSSHEYRKSASDHLSWLSRRWLFNIPKSGQVEGLRPLGRLAVVSGLEDVRRQLRKCIEAATSDSSMEQSGNLLEQPWHRNSINIVLVGSVAGGTASGSFFDLVWLARSVGTQERMPDLNVSAVLLHGTAAGRNAADMHDANALSFLKELRYHVTSGLRGPSHSGGASFDRPLDDLWMIHFGDDLTTADFSRGVDAVAEYLQLQSVSPAGREMQAWKLAAKKASVDNSEITLRTFGLNRISSDSWTAANSESSRLAAALLLRLSKMSITECAPETLGQLTQDLQPILTDFHLTPDGAISLVPKLVNTDRTRRLDEYSASLVSRISESRQLDDVAAKAAMLVSQDTATPQLYPNSIANILEEIRQELLLVLADAQGRIETLLREGIDSLGRFGAADAILSLLQRSIDVSLTATARQKADLQQAFTELCASISQNSETGTSSHRTSVKAFCRQYTMLLVCQTASQCVSSHLKALRDWLNKYRSERLDAGRRRVFAMSEFLNREATAPLDQNDDRIPQFDEYLRAGGRFRLSQFAARDPRPQDASSLGSEAAAFLLANSRDIRKTQSSAVSHESRLAAARPHLQHVGGGHRILAVIPNEIPADDWKKELNGEFGNCVTVCPCRHDSITIICEVEGIAISSVVDSLSQLNPRVVELSERVHSRQDISW